MTRAELLQRISEYLSDVTDREITDLTEASTADDYEEWDSISHVRLLIRIEQDLGFQFNTDEVGMVENVGQLIDLIEKKLQKA